MSAGVLIGSRRVSVPSVPPVALLGAAAVLPLFFAPASLVLHNLVVAAAFVMMALGLNIVVGFAGLLDLGYVAFYAIGAHVAAHLASGYWGLHLNVVLVMALAIAATTLAGVLIGVPTLRLRGDYVALVTLAFGEIIGQVIGNGRDIVIFGHPLTGGPNGMSGVDKPVLPLLGRFSALDLRPWYWFGLALVALSVLVSVRLRDSRVGRAWLALREDEAAAACAGVPIARTKLLAYGAGAAFGGVAGVYLASYESFVDPHQFTFSFSIYILAMVVLGGLGSIRGVVAGAIVLSLVDNYLLPRAFVDLSQIESGLYGLVLVLVVLMRYSAGLQTRRG